ncbi:MAG: response regulator transcription factor [Saprospiraceae bacterium]|nr:response regulator transcription factor [Candidatus Brachybacter algidus]
MAEYEVLKALWEGLTNQQIGERIHLSVNTVKTHLRNIFSKLDVESRSEALAFLRNLSSS